MADMGCGERDIPITVGSRPICSTQTNIGSSNPCHKLPLQPSLDCANWWANAAKLSSISKTQVRPTKSIKKRLGLPEPTPMEANSRLPKATSPSILRNIINLIESMVTLILGRRVRLNSIQPMMWSWESSKRSRCWMLASFMM
ncbi:hypothetical protein V6N11_047302 [Hibiscus sabdariffa]|uniref:Uncharacterized protein n=1 Tax=Hibiscus sabdariffa TaxID=183260 RepID=A0ABR2PBK6_9ROSI